MTTVRRGLALFASLSLMVGAAPDSNSPSVRTAGPGCDGPRAAVATLQDPAAVQVRLAPTDTTVTALRHFRAPEELGPGRVPGVETTTFRVIARLLAAQADPAGGVRLVVADPVTGGSMVMTLPPPACTTRANPAVQAMMASARASFVAVCGQPPRSFEQLRGQATITGVGFFNPVRDQPGEAPNRLELGPVLGLSSVGCHSGPATGLYGVVRRGPTTPVCVVGVPCSAPVAGAKLIFSADGEALARARSASDGSYRIELAPGLYSVRAEPAIGFPGRGPRPSRVRVTDKGVTHIDFWFDTGIR